MPAAPWTLRLTLCDHRSGLRFALSRYPVKSHIHAGNSISEAQTTGSCIILLIIRCTVLWV